MSDEDLIASAKQKVATGAYRAGYAAGFAQAKEMAADLVRQIASWNEVLACAIEDLTAPTREPLAKGLNRTEDE